MLRRPTESPRTDPLFPYTTLVRSLRRGERAEGFTDHARCRAAHHPGVSCGDTIGIRELIFRAASLAFRIGFFRTRLDSDTDGRTCFSQTQIRSEEHTSELQSLMRISYAVFCMKKTKHTTNNK